MDYDIIYGKNDHVFGKEAEPMLKRYIHSIDKTLPVLDIGAGQGRNAFFLAEKGFTVHATDISKIAVETLKSIAQDRNYKIETSHTDFIRDPAGFKNPQGLFGRGGNPKDLKYSAVMIFGLIQLLDHNSIQRLIQKVNDLTHKGSLVFVTAFLKGDDSYQRYRQNWKAAGKHSFTDGEGNFRTFLKRNEILKLFKNYTVIDHYEGTGPIHRHGDGTPEQHRVIELVAEKTV